MTELKINYESLRDDFHDWLTHPLTETFAKILTVLKEEYLAAAHDISYNNYYREKKSEIATLNYGKADGIDTILSVLQDCRNNKEAINNLFKQTIEPNEK